MTLKLTGLCLLPALILAACAPGKPSPQDTQKHLEIVHEGALVLDSHVDIELDLIAPDMDPWSSGKSQVDLDKMDAGAMDAAFLIIYTPQGEDTDEAIAEAEKIAETRFEAISRLMEKYPDRIGLAKTAAQARSLQKSGRHIGFIGMENAYPLGRSVDNVDTWAARGVRYLGITHFGHNQFGDSSNPNHARGETASRHGGLSPLGRDLVAALNTAGIMVDVSHAGKDTMLQAAELSKVPIIASHSGARALADHPRNLDDQQLKALAANGGVIQIVAFGSYIKPPTPGQKQATLQIRREMGLEEDSKFYAIDAATQAVFDERMKPVKAMQPEASIADLADHIDYTARLIGIDHVGIASDFDGGGGIAGWMDAGDTQNVTQELLSRGYSPADIEKIWSGNLLRVLQAAQTYAKNNN